MSKIVASVLWRRLDHEGHDACRLIDTGGGWALVGQASFMEEGGLLCGLAYDIRCARDWTTRSARVSGFVDNEPLDWRVDRSQSGAWTVNGERQPSLDGLVDVDLGLTPATIWSPCAGFRLRPGRRRLRPPHGLLFPNCGWTGWSRRTAASTPTATTTPASTTTRC